MAIRNTLTSYGSVAKFFHWTIFFLILCMLIFGYFMEDFPADYKAVAYNAHKLTGLLILSLMVLRLLWAWMNVKPMLPVMTRWWERLLERVVHFALYAVVIAMPLAGWVGSVAAGRLPQLGSFSFDLPIHQDKSLAKTAFTWHKEIAIIIIVLVSLHVFAALYHHFVKKDDVLRRMMPR